MKKFKGLFYSVAVLLIPILLRGGWEELWLIFRK